MNEPLILGIESTCDETGVALVRGGKLLADRTATSMDEHARYGGIIPEIASRAHLESFLPTLQSACEEAGVTLDEVDAIACAAGPGLVGSLTVGISAAKALALSLDKPLYGVNHVIGHLAVDALVEGQFHPPFIAREATPTWCWCGVWPAILLNLAVPWMMPLGKPSIK